MIFFVRLIRLNFVMISYEIFYAVVFFSFFVFILHLSDRFEFINEYVSTILNDV